MTKLIEKYAVDMIEDMDEVVDQVEEKEYIYEMTARPVSIGTQPKGFKWFDEEQGEWGIVAYDRELTEQELIEYEMREW